MERMSGLDASFLYFETPNMHMHVIGVIVFDPTSSPEGYDFEVARQKLQKQLDDVGKHAAQHEARLNDSRFMSKADPETKVEVAQRFEGLQAQQKLLTAQLQQLGENAI